jgi:hypothetical protein
MDHVARPLHILLVEKEGRTWFNIKCLKLFYFKRIIWWCLSVLEFVLESILEFVLEYILESSLKYVLEFILLEFFFKVMFYRNLSKRWA